MSYWLTGQANSRNWAISRGKHMSLPLYKANGQVWRGASGSLVCHVTYGGHQSQLSSISITWQFMFDFLCPLFTAAYKLMNNSLPNTFKNSKKQSRITHNGNITKRIAIAARLNKNTQMIFSPCPSDWPIDMLEVEDNLRFPPMFFCHFSSKYW